MILIIAFQLTTLKVTNYFKLTESSKALLVRLHLSFEKGGIKKLIIFGTVLLQ